MDNEQENQEQIPGKRSPFRVIRKKDGKTYVEPDARLITQEQVIEKGGWSRDFRKFIEGYHIQYYVFGLFIIIAVYEVASHYYPAYTPLVTGLTVLSAIMSAMGAYSTAAREDVSHREWIHVSRFEAEEVDLGPDLDDINVSRKTLKIKFTDVRIYEMRSYQRTDESAFRLHFENDQVFEGITKIHEVTSVDDTGRIFIGERDGIPAGVIFKLGMPSVDYVSKQIGKIKKQAESNGNNYDDIKQFAKMHRAWAKQWDYMQHFLKTKGLVGFSVDDMPKWARNYFFALEKASLPYWNNDPKTSESGLGYWHGLSSEFRMPILLRIQRDYNQIRGEKVQLVTTRKSDMLEAEANAVTDLLTMLGITHEELKKILLQRTMSLTPIEDRVVKEAEKEIGADGRSEE